MSVDSLIATFQMPLRPHEQGYVTGRARFFPQVRHHPQKRRKQMVGPDERIEPHQYRQPARHGKSKQNASMSRCEQIPIFISFMMLVRRKYGEPDGFL